MTPEFHPPIRIDHIGEGETHQHIAADADERRRLQAWIVARQRESGGGATRRLNRRELSAALQDVTGLPIDFAAGLPDDGKVDGFDTGADGL